MRLKTIMVFTHDSVGLGEDGPTHQPVEQLVGLRAIPGYTVIRPADANEVTEAWRSALARPGPVALILTRQKLPVLDPAAFRVRAGAGRGAYVLSDPKDVPPKVVIVATGSEVTLALAAQGKLATAGTPARVVSMPSWEIFEEQSEEYRRSVLPGSLPTVAVEAGSPIGWERYVGRHGRIVAVRRFGASGPGPAVFAEVGLTVDRVVSAAQDLVRNGSRPGSP